MPKALVVGIDAYQNVAPLVGCVADARRVDAMLARHANGDKNFETLLMTAASPDEQISRKELREAIEQVFQGKSDVSLLYFAGHGYVESAGGFLCSSDVETGDEGIALSDVMTWVNRSPALNKIVILDSCHSGVVGKNPISPIVEIGEGVTILTASTEEQYAQESDGAGVFTSLLIDALEGAAANVLGDVTPGSVYAHIDQSLGAFAQRPVFKTNIETFVRLRRVVPPIELVELIKIAEFFPAAGVELMLDPGFEPERSGAEPEGTPPPDPKKTKVFEVLQKLNRINLVVPMDAPHMWHAAMRSKSCALTPLGEHYRRLVLNGKI